MTRQSDKVLERLYKLHPKIIDLSLDRMQRILKRLGHPEKRLPPVIHVAGTNGKGSTTAYLRAILEAAGLRVHVYTSPHLVRFAERIRLASRLIREDYLLEVLQECEALNDGEPITYFEITTAIAFKAFADVPADVVLLEVGLGGRLDATNMVDNPLSTVITPVSLDHEQFLGSELGGIAREKAGIAKTGVPLILAPQPAEALKAILNVAAEVKALPVAGEHWQVHKTKDGFCYTDKQGQINLPEPNLFGPHQISNAALAIACLRHQPALKISEDHIKVGITSAYWPARMQNITQTSLGDILPKGSSLWLDGGHNPAAGEILANFFKTKTDRPLYLICGMMKNKDTAGFLKPLSPLVTKCFGLHVDGEDSHAAEDIARMAHSAAIEASPSAQVDHALKEIAQLEDSPVQVLICGSLYLAGQILAMTSVEIL